MSGLRDIGDPTQAVGRHATPAQSTQPTLTYTKKVHMKSVSAVAFFKDGQRVATSSWDRTVQIWDVKNKALVGGPFKGHSDYVYSVAISPDDRQIASGGEDGAIAIWDVDKKPMAFKPLMKHRGQVWSVCFSPDGKRLARGYDETVIICDAKTSAILSTLQGVGAVYCVAFSPDGLKLASGTQCKIRVWSTDNAMVLFDINAHDGWVHSVKWSPDGQQLVSASEDKTVKFWDSLNGTQIGQPCFGHTNDINSLAISSDGSFIATASDDKTVRLWNMKSHQQIGEPLQHTTYVCCVAISLSGELLASGDFDGHLQLLSIENTISTAFAMDSSYFVHRSKVRLSQNLHTEALSDANKVIELNPSSHLGYELKYKALRVARRHDDASEAFTVMFYKMNNAHDPWIQQLGQQHRRQYEVESAIRKVIEAQLKKAPLRLINTSTGRLCDQGVRIDAFIESTEYEELTSLGMHGSLQTELIKETVTKYFSWVMLSHRWGAKEPLLHDIQGRDIYDLDPVGTVVKLQKFCKVAHVAGHRWAWSDTCCIDQNNNAELQESVISMFVWYRDSALTIVYLSDVPSLSLANSTWNTRGWTVQEFLAPRIILFYQADWTPYLDDRSCNHKQSDRILCELKHSTGINARALVDFHPGTRDSREKLRWASNRKTTKEEDIAYSLYGIFDVNLPVIYGEKKQKALGRLLQYIVAHSGNVTALDWVGQSSNFNSCLPADISSYKGLSCTLPPLSEHDSQILVPTLRNDIVVVESASKLYTVLEKFSVPRFSDARLQLPCITFPLTEVRLRLGQDKARCSTYDVKADGLRDVVITTEDKLVQFSPAMRTQQTFLLIHPWIRDLLELPDFADESQSVGNWPDELVTRQLRLLVRLSRRFGALLLARQRGGEYKRIASDNNIIAQVRDMAAINRIDVEILEIL